MVTYFNFPSKRKRQNVYANLELPRQYKGCFHTDTTEKTSPLLTEDLIYDQADLEYSLVFC